MVPLTARRLGVLCLAALGWLGCDAPPVEAPLITIHSVGPAVWSPGTHASVAASGLPMGREGELHLEGTLHRPAADPLAVDRRLVVRATASGRAEALLEHAWLEELGERGTFEGRATLRFEGPDGATVFGTADDVRIDVMATAGVARRDDPAVAELAALGLHFAADRPEDLDAPLDEEDEDDDEPELLLGRLDAVSGAAARAGLQAGDQVTALAGVVLQGPADRRIDPDAPSLEVRFRREGLRGERSLVLERTPAETSHEAPLLPWVIAGLLLALFGTPLRHTRRHFHTLRREWTRDRRASARALGAAALGVVVTLALWPLGLPARVAAVLVAGAVASPTLGGLWRHVPAAAFVAAAPLFVGEGSLAPTTWPLLRAPLLLPLFVVAALPLLKIQGARWRRAPRAVGLTALLAAATAAPASLPAALALVGLGLASSLAVVPDRQPDRRAALLTLALTGGSIALLLFGHLRLALPPARATWNEMAPAAAVAVLLLVATVAAARTRVRAPFGL
ncbi:MAG: hypothetical protein CMN30_02095 [Sandaracinus sp.]|nr:hypothetical protein [Sandaracinus sp.]|tara:strand:- start:2500 stop:4029 length:1530 start_codon:yes stop_codon:yes gene_type:complete